MGVQLLLLTYRSTGVLHPEGMQLLLEERSSTGVRVRTEVRGDAGSCSGVWGSQSEQSVHQLGML